MKFRNSVVLAAIITLFSSMSFAGSKVGIIYNDDYDNINILRNGLLQYNDFEQIDLINWSSTPDPVKISQYDSVIVTESHKPVSNSKQWGDIIADYAEAGGGAVLGFAFYNAEGPIVDYGKLEDPLHSPFTVTGELSIAPWDDSLGDILIPSNPIMNGVTELTTHYRYDVVVNEGATLVATFSSGVPLAGFMDVGKGRVVGIQGAYLLNPYYTNEGDYMQLYRNATLYSVPEPATLLLLAAGGMILRRKR